MIIAAAPPGVASFTDDSSPDTRRTGGTKVSIHAQVLREESLDWYFRLISFYPDIPGELKSARILAGFSNLSPHIRQKVWSGLRRVRIHLSDPRLYRRQHERTFEEVWQRPDAMQLLRQAASAGDRIARQLQDLIEESIARQIIVDSPSHRLAAAILGPQEYSWCLNRSLPKLPDPIDPEVDLQTLRGKDARSLVRRLAEITSKSASAFTDALDAARARLSDDEIELRYFGSLMRVRRRRVRDALLPPHAFDDGNELAFRHIQQRREELITLSDDLGSVGIGAVGPLVTFGSQDSLHGQAADVAARFAASLYEHRGLIAVVKRFEYVTFNGGRATERNAHEHLRLWNDLAS